MIRPLIVRSTVAASALVVWAGYAAAEPKVALTAIDNDPGGDVRDAVAEALEGPDMTVIGEKLTNRAIGKLKGELADLTARDAKRLGVELDADAIVHASLGREAGSKLLKFKLFVHGKKAKGFSVLFSNPRSNKFKHALHDKMVEKLAKLGAGAGEDLKEPKPNKTTKPTTLAAIGVDDEDPNADNKPSKPSKFAKPGKLAKPDPERDAEPANPHAAKAKTTAKRGDGEGEGVGDAGPVAVAVRAPARTRAANRVAVRLDVGASISTRRLEFTTTAALGDVNGVDKRPSAFKPGPVPGARFEIESYPVAFRNPNSWAAGLGIAIGYDKVLSSNVTTPVGSAEPGITMAVKQQQYALGARFRKAFGKSAVSPTISGGVDYGRRTFTVRNTLADRNNLDLPDTDYKYIAPVAGVRIPFTANFAFVADATVFAVLDAGSIQQADSYGQARVFGAGGRAGLDFVIRDRFAFRVIGEFSQIGFAFKGIGELANNRDMDPASIDIGGAYDRSFGGSATFAVLY